MTNSADIAWFKEQFGKEIETALSGTLFDLDMIVAIACQETGDIWSILRKKPFSRREILSLCVGDTIEKGRRAFPKSKAVLIAKPKGQRMFDIARRALVEMAREVPGYKKAAANPDKFCHGFGLFQRDLQFFLKDPEYFLERKYEIFGNTLEQCLNELDRGMATLGYRKKKSLTDREFANVAIAYNTGGFDPDKGLKQGHFDGSRYYGELILDFVELSRSVKGRGATPFPGRFVVIARNGLKLRNGPGLEFDATRTLAAGTELTVMAFDGPAGDWARVDLEGDGLIDGHAFAAFLSPSASAPTSEEAEEPGEPEEG